MRPLSLSCRRELWRCIALISENGDISARYVAGLVRASTTVRGIRLDGRLCGQSKCGRDIFTGLYVLLVACLAHLGSILGLLHRTLSTPVRHDVRYDAYLASDRTFDDPEVVAVDKGGRVRLRIIDGGTATAFFVSAPGLKSRCIAVDGSLCQPVSQPSYPLAAGQRIDLLVQIPQQGGAFPVYARVEADRFVTGIVLATPGASVQKLPALADKPQGMVTLGLEMQLRAVQPLAVRRPDKTHMVMLGEGPGYRWTINGRAHGEHQANKRGAGAPPHVRQLSEDARFAWRRLAGLRIARLSHGYSAQRSEDAEGLQQPNDYGDDDDAIQDLLDLAVHRDVVVHEVQKHPHDDEANDDLLQVHACFSGRRLSVQSTIHTPRAGRAAASGTTHSCAVFAQTASAR